MSITEMILPKPVVGPVGTVVNLRDLLAMEFGPTLGGYPYFNVSYPSKNWLITVTGSNPPFSYWDPANPVVSSWTYNGQDIGPSDQGHFTGVSAAQIDPIDFHIGNAIGPFPVIQVPVAFDSNNAATDWIEYHINTVDTSLVSPTAGSGVPTPNDVVNAAYRFAAAYSGVPNNDDCWNIASDVATSAGAALPELSGSTDPTQNQSGGFWRVVYRGTDPNAVIDWSTLVQAGDIVRLGWLAGGAHSFVVTSVLPGNSFARDLMVFDNAAPGNGTTCIGLHDDGAKWDLDSNFQQVTIYRLSADHLYLIQGTDLGDHLSGTQFNDQIIGGKGDDTISGWIGNDVLDGKGGINTADYSWVTTGIAVDLQSGSVSKGQGNGTDTVSNIQKFIGGAGDNSFRTAYGAFWVYGGAGGPNTLDYSWDSSGIAIDLHQQTVLKGQYWGPGFLNLQDAGVDHFFNIHKFIGGSGNDIFTSTNGDNYTFWGGLGTGNTLDYASGVNPITVTLIAKGVGQGHVDKATGTDTFDRITHFIGGSADDTFIVGSDPSYVIGGVSYTFDGGAKVKANTLDYSTEANGVKVDVGQGFVWKSYDPVQHKWGSLGTDTIVNHSFQNFIGGTGANIFVSGLAPSGAASGAEYSFKGGAGADTLDYSWDGFGVVFDLRHGTVTKNVAGSFYLPRWDTFSSIERFVGGSGANLFEGIDAGSYYFDGGAGGANTLDYSANANAVTVNLQDSSGTRDGTVQKSGNGRILYGAAVTDSFFNIQTFVGSAKDDTFVSVAGLDYTFKGGLGTDTLDYSWEKSAKITIDLKAGTVNKGTYMNSSLGTDHFSSIENFKGGTGSDTVVLHDIHADYDFSQSYLGSDNLWHTVVVDKLGASGDPRVDLVNIEWLNCQDGLFKITSPPLSSVSAGSAVPAQTSATAGSIALLANYMASSFVAPPVAGPAPITQPTSFGEHPALATPGRG